MISSYLLDIIILLTAAVIAVPVFQSLKLGAVPGFLIAGIIVGPSGFKLISTTTEISHLAEIGVVLLLFVIGIEIKPSRLWLMRRFVFGLGTVQVLITGLVISAVAYFVFDTSLRAAILIGPTLALSSTAFVLQLLTEQKSLNSAYGRPSFAVLLLQDLAVVPLLALVPLLSVSELSIGADIGIALIETIIILVIVVVLGRYILHPIIHRVALSGNSDVFTASAILLVLGTALLTEHLGLSMAMGAFLAGLLISDSVYKHQVMAEIQPFRGFLLGLFFMSMGMSLDLSLLFESPISSLMLVLILLVVKAALLYPAALIFGLNKRHSLAVALVLAESGEFALVIFSLAFQSQLLTETLFQKLLLIALLSMLTTPLLAHYAYRIGKYRTDKKPDEIECVDEAVPIVLAGYGRVGRRIGNILAMTHTPFIALDSDARVVENEKKHGHPVYYGDVCKPEVLKASGTAEAKVIIVTIDDPGATESIVSTLHQFYPDKEIYARGHSLTQCRELKKHGATEVVSENIEASLELARLTMKKVGIDKSQRHTVLTEFRKTYQDQINLPIDS